MKKIELTHDIIAKEVFNSASELHRMRRDIERRIKNRYTDYQNSGIPLSTEELHLILPYLGIVRLSEEQKSFVLDMERKAANERRKKARKRKNIFLGLAGSSTIFILLSVVAFIQWNRAEEKSQENLARSFLSDAKNALTSGEPFLATSLADTAIVLAQNSGIINQAEKVKTDVASYPIEFEVKHGEDIMKFGFWGEGESFYALSKAGILKIWDIDGKLTKTVNLQSSITEIIVSDKQDLLAILTESNEIQILNKLGFVQGKYKAKHKVIGMDFSQDGRYFLFITDEQTLKILSVENNKEILRISSFALKQARFVQLENNGDYSIIAISDSSALLYDFSGKKIDSFTENLKRYGNLPISGFEVDSDNKLILFHSIKGDFIFNTWGFPANDPISRDFNSGNYSRAKFSQGAKKHRLLGFSRDSLSFIVWDQDKEVSDFLYNNNPYFISGAETSSNTKYIVCYIEDNTLVVFRELDAPSTDDLPSYRIAGKLKCKISSLVFARSDKYFLSHYKGESLKLWNLEKFEF